MARGSANVQPKADQPRVSTESLKRTESGPSLQYRVEGIKGLARSPSVRNYRSTKRT
jgi:hypothetical protein